MPLGGCNQSRKGVILSLGMHYVLYHTLKQQSLSDADDSFRSNFLWGRKPLLAACAARLDGMSDMVWVDLGGGTGENVSMMSKYIDLKRFKKIYIVDLCHSLCEEAKKKAKENGWENVTVVEADACEFSPDEDKATLVTFSYSLSSTYFIQSR